MKEAFGFDDNSGSLLISTIVAMVIVSILGIAMFSMTSSSRMTHVSGKMTKDAFYMAESGFRYVASELYHVTEEKGSVRDRAQNEEAHAINGRTLNLAEGSIEITLTPFHFVTSQGIKKNDTNLPVRFPGETPSRFAIPNQGMLEIEGIRINFSGFANNSFTLANGMPRDIPEWTTVTILASPTSKQTITPGSDNSALTLVNSKHAEGFFMPERNGKFAIQGNPFIYQYDYRADGNSTTLYGVRNSENPLDDTPFTVTTDTIIIPQNFFRVESRGTVGNASRRLTFIAPVDLVRGSGTFDETTSVDTFSDSRVNPGHEDSSWETSTRGSHSIQNINSNYALWVNKDHYWENQYRHSLVTSKYSGFADFRGAWLGSNHTLSYDSQVKLKLPDRSSYMAGMLFRANLPSDDWVDYSMLGVSLLRRNENTTSSTDNIYDDLVPVSGRPLIVLWQKAEGEYPGMNWIAYKNLLTLYYKEDNNKFFSNKNDFFIKGADSGARAHVESVTPGSGGCGEFSCSSIYSSFKRDENFIFYKYHNSTQRIRNWYSMSGEIEFNNRNHGVQLGDIVRGSESGATAFVDSVDDDSVFVSEREGSFQSGRWVTNDRIIIYRPEPNNNAAKLDYALTDILTGVNNRHIKDWTTLLVRVEEKLENNSPVNHIRVYVGDTDKQGGTPDGSPMDADRHANPRWVSSISPESVKWPPDEGWAGVLQDGTEEEKNDIKARDHFTLIRGWTMNSSFSSTFTLTGSDEEPNAIIKTALFTTNGLENFNRQELGLWTAGGGMAGNTYFDDFAVRLKGGVRTGTRSGLSSPLMY